MRNACLLFPIALWFAAAPLRAATVTYSSTCAIGSTQSVGTSSCGLSGIGPDTRSQGFASATVSLSYYVSSIGGSLEFSGSAKSSAGVSQVLGAPEAIATLSATTQVDIYVPGTGSGYILETINGSNDADYDGGGDLLRITGSEGGYGFCGGSPTEFPTCNLTGRFSNPPVIVPITLGTVDSFTVSLQGEDAAIVLNGVSRSSMNFTEQFLFVAQDGRTPLAIQEVATAPEPAALEMLFAGLAAVGFAMSKKRLRRT